MGYIDINAVSFTLSDGRPLLDDVSFRVTEGKTTALIGENGAGKSTLFRIVRGIEKPDSGAVTIGGGLGVMDQFIGHGKPGETVHSLLISVAPPAIKAAALELEASESAMIAEDVEANQMRFASAIADYADAGGYDYETVWDHVTMAAMGMPFDTARFRDLGTLSGGEQKRLALEALFRGPDEVLLLDEPDNYLDVPGKRWLEEQLRSTRKTVFVISHDRELLANAVDRLATLEVGGAGATAWIHGGGFNTYHEAREARMDRLEELRRRWEEEHEKLRSLMLTLRAQAASSPDMANRYHAAQTRLAKFEEAGPPQERPREQNIDMRLQGGRTGKRAVVAEDLEMTGLMKPFSTEIWFGDRVGVLGSNGSGKSHFLRLLARGGTNPDASLGHITSAGQKAKPVPHTGTVVLGARVIPGWFAQTHQHPEFVGRTLLDILHRGDESRKGLERSAASSVLGRYGLTAQAESNFERLSGGQQARFQVLLLELSGVTLLLLDEPTDNLDLVSAEELESAIARFDGTVLAVTHDRWFARGFDRFLVFGSDGEVYESAEPVWDETRVVRER